MRRKTRRKAGRKVRQRGMITVFATLMMVPVVVITGCMTDFAKIKLYSSQAVMAADAYGEAILSEYDNLLKELYGLFSVTQNEQGLAAVEELKAYAKNSFSPNQDGRGFSGFMPYESADVDLVYEKVEGASLSNNNVLMTQISDFMKYRIVEEVLAEDSVLETLSSFDSMSTDMDAMDQRNELTESSQDALEEVSDYYVLLEKINDYPSFKEIMEDRYKSYSAKLTEISTGSDYADYVEYLQNKAACDAALEKKRRIESSEDSEEELSAEEERLADLAERVGNYDQVIKGAVSSLKEEAWNYENTGKKTNYDDARDQISDLGKSADKVDKLLTELYNKVNQLKGTLSSCSETIREQMQQEIRELENVIDHKKDFQETYYLIETVNQDSQKSRDNKELIEEELGKLDQVFDNLVSGNIQPGDSYWTAEVSLEWYDFQNDKASFYSQLQKICGSGGSGGDKDAGEKKKNEAKDAQAQAEAAINNDDTPDTARDISSSLASQLQSSGATGGAVPDISSYFSGGLSFEAVGGAGTALLDKFLVTSYDFGMFSSRVSGIQPEGEEGENGQGGTGQGAYYDESLTGYRISGNINYLYGAELEYLLGGHNSSKDNLNKSRNIICGVRLTMNFISTYRIKAINDAISAVANTAASAVAASGVGAAVAPLVRVAVSGALRAAIATMETAADWESLKAREKVIFLKGSLDEMESLDSILSLLGVSVGEDSGQNEKSFELGYEDYLYILLCLLIDSDTLMSRTSNLITLNMNQAQNTGDTLTNLEFKMSETVTAVKSTCKVKMDFTVTPQNFIEMYLSGTSGEATIEALEDEYFGYSIIRGY